MQIKNILGRNKVVVLKVNEADVDGLLLNTDLQNDGTLAFVVDNFVSSLMNLLPEYAFAYHNSAVTTERERLIEAAKSVLKIKEIKKLKEYFDSNLGEDKWEQDVLDIYMKKGIFGELILHFLLREFKGTLPLISKVYFKDSFGHEAHGFDAVHVSENTEQNILWLGECKFYTEPRGGLKELIEDLKYFTTDYLNEQYIIIDRALNASHHPDRDRWIAELKDKMGLGLLKDMFNLICVPLLCLYQSDIPSQLLSLPESDFDVIYLEHITSLKKYFDDNNDFANKNHVEIVLMLFPLDSKKKIIELILNRLYHMQSM